MELLIVDNLSFRGSTRQSDIIQWWPYTMAAKTADDLVNNKIWQQHSSRKKLQETQLSPTSRVTRVCANAMASWLVADLKRRPSHYILPCRIWSLQVKVCRHNYQENPQNWGAWNSALLGWEAWLTPRYMPPPSKTPTCSDGQKFKN